MPRKLSMPRGKKAPAKPETNERRRGGGSSNHSARTKTKATIASVFLFAAGFLYAQEEPRVMLETSLEPPVVGSTWTLTVLVDHGTPSQVRVADPPFAEGLSLEQVLQGPRLVNLGSWLAGAAHATAYERWTATEYRFVLNAPGVFVIEPFTVITPRGRAQTMPFTLEVQSPQAAAGIRGRNTEWAGLPGGLAVGDDAVFTLRLGAAESPGGGAVPRPALFMPQVPPGHILESLPVGEADAAGGALLRLRLIPLEAGEFSLEPRSFSYGGSVFQIPALRVPVARSQRPLAVEAPDAQAAVPVALVRLPPFPSPENALAANPRLRQRYADEFRAAHLTALNLWERGYAANALALLRKNERDHRAGALFAQVRREAELALGITETRDERRRQALFGGGARGAVLRETAARRVPDDAGEKTAFFAEGQPVTVGRNGGPGASWVFVATDNGASGWIPGENIIFY